MVLKGDTNIKYLEDNNALFGDQMLFRAIFPGCKKKEFFLKVLQSILLIGIKAMEEYGQRIKEDPEFAERWVMLDQFTGNNGEDGNIMITTKRGLLNRST